MFYASAVRSKQSRLSHKAKDIFILNKNIEGQVETTPVALTLCGNGRTRFFPHHKLSSSTKYGRIDTDSTERRSGVVN